MQCPQCGSQVPAESPAAPHGRRVWPLVVAVVAALLLGGAAGAAGALMLTAEPQIEVDPWYAFVDEAEWRATPEEALAVVANAQYGGADYWYVLVSEDDEEVDYLVGLDGETYDYRVKALAWHGRWYAGGAHPSTLDLQPVKVSGETP